MGPGCAVIRAMQIICISVIGLLWILLRACTWIPRLLSHCIFITTYETYAFIRFLFYLLLSRLPFWMQYCYILILTHDINLSSRSSRSHTRLTRHRSSRRSLHCFHPQLMVLSNCISQSTGPFCFARKTILSGEIRTKIDDHVRFMLIQSLYESSFSHICASVLYFILMGWSILYCYTRQIGTAFLTWLNRLQWPPPICLSSKSRSKGFIPLPDYVFLNVAMLMNYEAYSVSFASHASDVVLIDNCATTHICKDRKSFISYKSLPSDASPVGTIGDKPVYAAGIGAVRWSWKDDEGNTVTKVFQNVLHFPSSKVNLISITAFASRDLGHPEAASIQTWGDRSTFQWDHEKGTRSIMHPVSRLPELPLIQVSNATPSAFTTFMHSFYRVVVDRHQEISLDTSLDVPEEEELTNQVENPALKTIRNSKTGKIAEHRSEWHSSSKEEQISSESLTKLSDLQERFLRWHERLNHIPMTSMIRLAERGFLPKEFIKLNRNIPPCGCCLFGKQHKRPRKDKRIGQGIRRPEHNYPGAGISVDHLISAQPGFFPQSSGILTTKRITAASIFVDHFTDFIYVALQETVSAAETLRAKHDFEQFAAENGVRISHYHSDNGRFSEASFTDDAKLNAQSLSFCGVGHHAQNGIAERKIGLLTEQARIMLLFAQRLWPQAISPILWPFALKMAAHLHNHFHLDENGASPASKFLRTSQDSLLTLSDFHTFGCPCYVMNSSGPIGPPKWNPRSNLRIYVGTSPLHASNVAMVLDPFTGLVSPQYHVVFDDHFMTLDGLRTNTVPSSWTELCATRTVQLPVDSSIFQPLSLEIQGSTSDQDSNSSALPRGDSSSSSSSSTSIPIQDDFISLESIGLRKTARSNAIKPKGWYASLVSVALTSAWIPNDIFVSTEDIQTDGFIACSVCYFQKCTYLVDGTFNAIGDFALLSEQVTNETYTYREAMQQSDAADFIRAMQKEVDDHVSRNHWSLIRRDSVPDTSSKPILSIWSFKRKRAPDGTLLKHKARLCAHGGMQKWGVNYWDTYSPTVNWLSVRSLLIVGLINNLATSTIDFTLAFPQVDLDVDVYMELPHGMVGPDGTRKNHILKLNKSLYGLKQASHNWFNYLCQALENRDFVRSQSDPCVFFRDGLVLLIYVDDIMIIGKDAAHVDSFKQSMKDGKENFCFTDGGNLENYLGVQVAKRADGSLLLTQPFLIQKIINAVIGDQRINPSKVPAIKNLLHKDSSGPARKFDFNYRQIVGMLTYLQGTTRPELAMSVHQCARFSSDPKLTHDRAIIRIIRYLEGTKDKGLIIRPDSLKGIECYVDASFASGWIADDADNVDNILSRTGYVIQYAGCPVHWSSKMQTEIALSTAEAEYIALSQASREVIPFMRLILEINVVFEINTDKPKMYCKIFEDNEACISMATSSKFTPRTKHIALKYHHF